MPAQSEVARDSLLGFGTRLEVEDTAGQWRTLAGVMDIDGPELATDDVEVTHQESPGATKEYRPGLKEGGAVTFDVVFLPGGTAHGTGDLGLAGLYASRAVRQWRLVWPTADGDRGGVQWSFCGFINAFKPAAPLADKLSASVSIKVSGTPTLQ